MHAPTNGHWKALKVVISYLIGSHNASLGFVADRKRRPGLHLFSNFTDYNFAGDGTYRKYICGAVLPYNGTELEWASRKKSLVALYTSEEEYVALASAIHLVEISRRLYI